MQNKQYKGAQWMFVWRTLKSGGYIKKDLRLTGDICFKLMSDNHRPLMYVHGKAMTALNNRNRLTDIHAGVIRMNPSWRRGRRKTVDA